ncbi:DUF3137 domain-containing protein [Gandjariella thermophila]|uniref:DUF3137 domain-containing protein n=1 Tax=Gandjariella thermophila TaxID=1931992 RepID=UPI001CEF94B9|nr:DUF3137 domain-containing protein [Gandjariella thermophila]
MAIAIAGAGCVLVFAGIAWLVIWLNRSNAAAEKAALGRLQEEAARRGWTFAERDDRYVDVYHAQVQLTERNPLQPLTPLPRASAARDVVTGTHRGRPFLAASFTVHHRHEQITQRCIWVRTPAPRPPLTVRRVGRAQRTVDAALGQYPSIGDPAFDERFEVSTGDERFARAVLNPRMTNFLLNEDRQFRGFALLGDQLEVLDPVSDHRDPAELIPALDLRCDILDLIPADVWK